MFVLAYVLSSIGIATYMAHFWQSYPASAVLWIISSVCAIWCIYGGIVGRARAENERGKAILTAVSIIGGLIFLGLTLSAIFLFVPRMT